jgi:hypothetical protein
VPARCAILQPLPARCTILGPRTMKKLIHQAHLLEVFSARRSCPRQQQPNVFYDSRGAMCVLIVGYWSSEMELDLLVFEPSPLSRGPTGLPILPALLPLPPALASSLHSHKLALRATELVRFAIHCRVLASLLHSFFSLLPLADPEQSTKSPTGSCGGVPYHTYLQDLNLTTSRFTSRVHE